MRKIFFITFFLLFVWHSAVLVASSTKEKSPTLQTLNAKQTSRNWSGYVANNGPYNGITGTWQVASVANSNFSAHATWVGIGGVENTDLIQAGTQSIIDRNGEVSYEAFYETLPDVAQSLDVNIQPGDSVTVSLTEVKTGQWQINFKNNTNHENISFPVNYDSSLSSADWIEEAPSSLRGIIPLADFGKVNFTEAYAYQNNTQISLTDTQAKPVTMSNAVGEILATPSNINDNGTSFDIARSNNSSNPEAYQRYYFRSRHFYFFPRIISMIKRTLVNN